MKAEFKEKDILLEDFEIWLKTNFTNRVSVKGHVFEKTTDGHVLIDKGKFSQDEAKMLFSAITSRNLFQKIDANIIIWERNGFLTKILIILSMLALILIVLRHKGL